MVNAGRNTVILATLRPEPRHTPVGTARTGISFRKNPGSKNRGFLFGVHKLDQLRYNRHQRRTNMAHNWSGWPGAYCTRCGAEDAFENAMGMGWVDLIGGGEEMLAEKWKSPTHEKLVKLCNNNCAADMTPEEYQKITEQEVALEQMIKEMEDGF